MKKQILSEEFKRMQKLAGLITEEETNTELSKEELEQLKKDAFKILQNPEFQKAMQQDIANMSDEKFKKSIQDTSSVISEEALNDYSTFSNIFDKMSQYIKENNLEEAFFRKSMQDYYDYYTPKGAYFKAFSVAAASLYAYGWNKFSVSLAAIAILTTFIRMTFFKKSPEELKKIKKEYEKLEQEYHNPTPDVPYETDPEKLKDFNKRLYGF